MVVPPRRGGFGAGDATEFLRANEGFERLGSLCRSITSKRFRRNRATFRTVPVSPPISPLR